MSGYPKVLRRDRLAHWLCAWVLRHVASSQYRSFVEVVGRAGVDGLPGWPDAYEERVNAAGRLRLTLRDERPYPGSRP